MLLRYSQHQIFIFIVELLQMLEFNTAISNMCRELTAVKNNNASDEEILEILRGIESG